MSYKILNTIGQNFDPKAKSVLDELGEVDYLNLDQKSLEEKVSSYDVLVIGLGLVINKAVINKAKNLKIIATATTGLDHIDISYAESKSISVLSLKGENEFLNSITGTAELAFGLIIDLLRHISSSFESVKNYQWQREKFVGNNLSGKTLGLVGLGRLGMMMVNYGKAFGMEVIAFDPYLTDDKFSNNGCQRVDFKTLLSQSDVISIHVPLTDETENMFNSEAFSAMKESAILINTARGKIVNEKDLLKALEDRTIAGYTTDVLADELNFKIDFRNHPLIEYAKNNNNLIITPHIGGMTYESRQKTDIFIAEKIKKYINKK